MKVTIEKAANGFILETECTPGKVSLSVDKKFLAHDFDEAILKLKDFLGLNIQDPTENPCLEIASPVTLPRKKRLEP